MWTPTKGDNGNSLEIQILTSTDQTTLNLKEYSYPVNLYRSIEVAQITFSINLPFGNYGSDNQPDTLC